MQKEYLINLIGSLSLAICDAQFKAMTKSSALNQNEVAAIMTLGVEYDYTIDSLSKVLCLSHSATTRLVNRLYTQKLVERVVREDQREVGLVLSKKGKQARKVLVAQRNKIIGNVIDNVADEDCAKLAEILPIMLRNLTYGRRSADHICRLCDENICSTEICPVELRAIELEAAVS